MYSYPCCLLGCNCVKTNSYTEFIIYIYSRFYPKYMYIVRDIDS